MGAGEEREKEGDPQNCLRVCEANYFVFFLPLFLVTEGARRRLGNSRRGRERTGGGRERDRQGKRHGQSHAEGEREWMRRGIAAQKTAVNEGKGGTHTIAQHSYMHMQNTCADVIGRETGDRTIGSEFTHTHTLTLADNTYRVWGKGTLVNWMKLLRTLRSPARI